jgi:hypothetical protein
MKRQAKRLHSNAHDDFQFPSRDARGAMSDHKYEIICHLIAEEMREKFLSSSPVFNVSTFSSHMIKDEAASDITDTGEKAAPAHE